MADKSNVSPLVTEPTPLLLSLVILLCAYPPSASTLRLPISRTTHMVPWPPPPPRGKYKKRIEKRIFIKTEDGIYRRAVLTLVAHARGNVVLCHPAANDKDFMRPYQDTIFYQYNCIRFDFRRHGEELAPYHSTAGKNEVYEVKAARNVFKHITETKNLPTFGFGISLGAATLIEAEHRFKLFDGLILQAPFAKWKDQLRQMVRIFRMPLIKHLMFRFPSTYVARRRYRVDLHRVCPINSIRSITTPIFLMHAQDDQFVSFSSFVALKQNGPSISHWWTPKRGEHTNLFRHKTEKYVQKCHTFLQQILKQLRT